ncbi:MAG: CotH kinase family protein [Treponema sp.]|nr:CotH kinase family protein [Treponema sp.]
MSCKDQPDDDYEIAEARRLTFSHNSGLYPQSFQLTLAAPAGSKVYYSIDGSIPLPSKATSGGPVFQYKAPITVQNRNGQPNLLATRENTTKFYMRPGDPRGSAPEIYYPTVEQVQKATVIRALTVDSNGKQSDVLTRTYFIGNNLQRYGNHPVISFVTDPKNLLDDATGIYVQGGPGYRVWPNYNFNKKGREWEREANLDFFDGSRNLAFSTGVGIRVRGGWSRDRGQKSFNVYFREEYGINNLSNYPLIPGAVKADQITPITRNKNFMLRNGGNDTDYTKFYDVFVQSLVSDRNFTTQAAVPCIVYLNGEYWSFYNLQEKYSDHYLEQKFGVNRNNVISVENWELDEGIESDMVLYWDMMSHQERDMSIQSNYEAFCEIFDIQSFIDYFAAQIYVNNEDWPNNNYQLWRVRNKEQGNPYGDGKWRWMMFDLDMTMGIYRGGEPIDPFPKVLDQDGNDYGNAKLFKQLLKNPDFSRQFVITMMDLYNVNFEYNSALAKLNEIAAIYRPLMPHYFERWGYPGQNQWNPGWTTVFENKASDARNYLRKVRDAMTNNYLPKHFGNLGSLVNVTLSAKNSGTNVPDASIKINTTSPSLAGGNWTGKYYTKYPVTVTANVPNGYEFVGWTVTGGAAVSPSTLTTLVNLSGSAQITANYRLTSGGITLSGNLILPVIDTPVQYVKSVLHNADWTWRREVSLALAGGENSAQWSTIITPFVNSTQIYFQVEGYENQDSISSLFVIDTGVSRSVHSGNINNISINLSDISLIRLSGTVSLAPDTPSDISYIGMRVMANGKILGQTAVPNTGSISNWQMYVPAQTANTQVKWNFYGFNNAALWDQIKPISSENKDVASCLSIYNQAKTNIDITNLSLMPESLALNPYVYNNAPAAISLNNQDGVYTVTLSSLGANTWDAALCFDYNGEKKAEYIYSFSAKTASGTRQMYVQYYWDETNGSLGQDITITETEQRFIIDGNPLPAVMHNTPSLQLQCAGQTGTFYISNVSIVPYVP